MGQKGKYTAKPDAPGGKRRRFSRNSGPAVLYARTLPSQVLPDPRGKRGRDRKQNEYICFSYFYVLNVNVSRSGCRVAGEAQRPGT